MENRNYNIIAEYISKEFDVNPNKLNIETSLSDLGLDGDDVLEFLLKFFKDFDIDYEQTNYRDFVPPESGFGLSTVLSFFNRNKKQSKNEILLKDLMTSLDKNQWYKEL